MNGAKKRSVILVGGGTGGHIVPIREVYDQLINQTKDLQVFVVGAGNEIEKKFFDDLGQNYIKITTGKWHRRISLLNILEGFKFIYGYFQTIVLIGRIKPKVIFAKGGYVSLPIALAAKLFHLPVFTHESDIEMGLVNKRIAKSAKKVFVSFPLDNYKNANHNLIFSGPILRPDLLIESKPDRKIFSFDNDKPVILITGGSQGALKINKTVVKTIPELIKSYNVIHQTGQNDFAWVNDFRNSLDFSFRTDYFVADFLTKIGDLDLMIEGLNLADLVVSRAGANTIFEIAAKNKPMILIPYKYSANSHQLKNARMIEEKGAALVVTDDELNEKVLISKIDELFSENKKELNRLEEKTKKLFPIDGLEMITAEIIKELNS